MNEIEDPEIQEVISACIELAKKTYKSLNTADYILEASFMTTAETMGKRYRRQVAEQGITNIHSSLWTSANRTYQIIEKLLPLIGEDIDDLH